jgi:hypothetical protein
MGVAKQNKEMNILVIYVRTQCVNAKKAKNIRQLSVITFCQVLTCHLHFMIGLHIKSLHVLPSTLAESHPHPL